MDGQVLFTIGGRKFHDGEIVTLEQLGLTPGACAAFGVHNRVKFEIDGRTQGKKTRVTLHPGNWRRPN